ncbi:hypothetical protein EHP00_1823 [Ecytonucleospora hepatopenaei]|uniref:Uncharacterized protein n=1 Tax=Ecytonucleospora hepatopenaei TaxID=646526 RepID=A0A1W0E5C7_9MICR|nr:hypothetical protein EHP00_1823 [Ecytonucleospora hepatopenaei]
MHSFRSYGSSIPKDDLQAKSVPNVPVDTISDICAGNNLVSVSSWDGSVRVYRKDGIDLNPMVLFDNLGAPVVSTCIINDSMVLAGLVDGNLHILDVNNTQNKKSIKAHDGIVKKIFFYNNAFVITVSFDGFYKVWDNTFKEVHSQNTNSKIYCMDLKEGHMALGLANKKVFYVDLNTNNMQELHTKFEYAIRSISINISGYGVEICVGSVEGKVEVINAKTQTSVSMRLHRADEKLYAVNQCIMVNEKLFITGGSDGNVFLNDKTTRFKIATSKYDRPVTAMVLKGDQLIFALGDDWSKGFVPQSLKTELMVADIRRFL